MPRVLAAVSTLVAAAGVVVAAGGPASALSCPTVDPATGAVSPAPTPGAAWAGCDLRGADLSLAYMPGSDLAGADLTGAVVDGTDLGQSDLSGATFTNANLRTAYLRGANVSSADFTAANLSYVLLDRADVAGAKLGTANLDGLESGMQTGTPASLPPHWVALKGCLLGPSADLSSADLEKADLSGLDLAGAAFFQVNLEFTNLRNADLRGADLEEASLHGANLTGTDITHADLGGVSSGHVIGIPKGLPSPWVLRDGYFFGPEANLYNAPLAGLDLSGTDLAGGFLESAHLSGADLAGVGLVGADMLQADLTGADLFGANVTNVNWEGATCPGIFWYQNQKQICGLAFRFGRFTTPRPGSFIRASAHSLSVRFSLVATVLTTRTGTPIADRVGAALAKARQVRVVLTGKGIKSATGYCTWIARHHRYLCRIRIPRHIATAKSHPYQLTVQEKPKQSFIMAVQAFGRAKNPETIYFH
jgi:uncharacterized protein YjbI with pentapeptide repeats